MGARRRAIEVDTFESETFDDDESSPLSLDRGSAEGVPEAPVRAVRRARQLVASAPAVAPPVEPKAGEREARLSRSEKAVPKAPPAPEYARGRELAALL